MSTLRFYLCAIPKKIWEEPILDADPRIDIVRFVNDALGCEKRIPKKVNLDNEYSRYVLCCQRIEQEIAKSGKCKIVDQGSKKFHSVLKSGSFPTIVLDSSYLGILSLAQDNPCPERFGASFYPPDRIVQHKTAFNGWISTNNLMGTTAAQQRLAFFQAAEVANCGVIEIQSCFLLPSTDEPVLVSASQSIVVEEMHQDTSSVDIPDFGTGVGASERFDQEHKKRMAANLRNQIRDALQNGEPVTFGNQASHDVITEVLNEFVFVPQGETPRPIKLRVAYADGSEATPFLLFCLKPITPTNEEDKLIPLRVALMSMRHLELDPEIDFCWFRNRDVSRTRTLAETDQFCFETTLGQLRDSLDIGDLVIQLYHTGFEPAVLGFYRGVVETLLNQRTGQAKSNLVIKPYYYRGRDGYHAGLEWR